MLISNALMLAVLAISPSVFFVKSDAPLHVANIFQYIKYDDTILLSLVNLTKD